MKIEPRMSEDERSEPWPERDMAEYVEQREAFVARWNAHPEAVNGPVEVQRTQLDREPPFALVSGEHEGRRVKVAMSRDDEYAILTAAEGGRRLSMREAADELGVHTVQLDRARAAIVDGLEQSERVAGRTPADRPSHDWVDLDLTPRFDEALRNGYARGEQSLKEFGINAAPVSWSGSQLKLSDQNLDAFAMMGRSATANVSELLTGAHRTEDVMEGVEVLAANPWDYSAAREEVEDLLELRLEDLGLRGTAQQTFEEHNTPVTRGVRMAGQQIAAQLTETNSPQAHAARVGREGLTTERAHEILNSAREEKRMAGPDSDSVRERNRARMERATRCGIQRAESPGDGPQRAPKIGR